MLEDVCHILNNGEVPELFLNEEKVKIVEEMDIYRFSENNDEKMFSDEEVEVETENT